jgi:integrase
MASIVKERKKQGYRYRIDFTDHTGQRRALRLGVSDRKYAEGVRAHIEKIVEAKITGQPLPKATAEWVASVGEPIRSKLESWDLIEPQVKRRVPTLGELVSEYLELRKPQVKPGTYESLEYAARSLTAVLSPNTPLDQITPVDAHRVYAEFRKALCESTANKRMQTCKAIFRFAAECGYIAANPFAVIRGLGVRGKKDRHQDVPSEEVIKLLKVIPNLEARTIVALARWNGLRIPSEIRDLRWRDIDWEKRRMIIRSPKLARYEDKAERCVAIFPEAFAFLQELRRLRPEASEDDNIFSETFTHRGNLRMYIEYYCRVSGIKLWPKLFINLRASHVNDINRAAFPPYVCHTWNGHSQEVANAHYMLIREEDYQRAASFVRVPELCGNSAIETIAIDNSEAQQKAQLKTAEIGGNRRKDGHGGPLNFREFPSVSASGRELPELRVGLTGQAENRSVHTTGVHQAILHYRRCDHVADNGMPPY